MCTALNGYLKVNGYIHNAQSSGERFRRTSMIVLHHMSILSGEQTHTYTQTEHLGTEMFSQCPVGCAQTLGHWEEGSPAVFGGCTLVISISYWRCFLSRRD